MVVGINKSKKKYLHTRKSFFELIISQTFEELSLEIRTIKVMAQRNFDQRHRNFLQGLLGQLPGRATSANAVFTLCVL